MSNRMIRSNGMTTRQLLAAAALAAVLSVDGAPLVAEVAVPAGCTPMATALKSACHATTFFECGATKLAYTFENSVLKVIHEYTPDWELTGSQFADFSSARMTVVPGTGANFQLDTLLETGRSQESGKFLFDIGVVKARAYTLSGHIELTGDTVELGGAVFQRASLYRLFEVKPGAGGMEFDLDLYFSPERNLLIEGDWTRSVFGSGKESFSQTPYHLAWPGEEGFLADRSEQGCE